MGKTIWSGDFDSFWENHPKYMAILLEIESLFLSTEKFLDDNFSDISLENVRVKFEAMYALNDLGIWFNKLAKHIQNSHQEAVNENDLFKLFLTMQMQPAFEKFIQVEEQYLDKIRQVFAAKKRIEKT